jgi:lysozyme
MNMAISPEGRQALESREGCVLHAYYDSVGVLTIGYGDTGNVVPGQVITQAEADQRLTNRLAQEFEPALNAGIKVQAKQNQFNAFGSFSYNVGTGAFLRSTMLKLFNAGDIAGTSAEFPKWCIPSVIIGRRAQERAQFDGHDDTSVYPTPELSTVDVQKALILLGYDLGPTGADGDYGKRTKSAVQAFQNDHGLRVDGLVGPKTLAALHDAVEHPGILFKIKSVLGL